MRGRRRQEDRRRRCLNGIRIHWESVTTGPLLPVNRVLRTVIPAVIPLVTLVDIRITMVLLVSIRIRVRTRCIPRSSTPASRILILTDR